jgi:tripartite-type tricarboxylate transporter receptor subunit TctC
MKRTVSAAKYCLFAAAAVACALAIALWPPEQEVLKLVPASPGTAYLDCARIQVERVSRPDLVAPCSVLASTATTRVAI